MSDLGNKDVFAKNLRRLMSVNNLTRYQMCEALGVSYSTFSDWVNGSKYPRIDKIEMMANYFGVQKSDLIENKSDAPSNAISITGAIPIYGQIAAGLPIFAEQNVEGYVPTVRTHPEDYFALKVKGDSMIGAGIYDGSVVVIRKQNFAEDGDIVACGLNGDEATLKRYRANPGDVVILMPENSAYTPIVVNKKDFDDGTAMIFGVAVEVMTKLN